MRHPFTAACIAILALGILGTIGGCTKKSEKGEGPSFGVSFQTMNNPFFIDLSEGLRTVAETRGGSLEICDAQWNSLKQKNDVSDLILKGADVIFLNPVNWEGVKGSLLQASEKKVPCIIVDAPVRDQELVLCTVASDNVEAGRLAAEALVAACRPARIAVICHSVNKACIDRVEGFTEEIAKYDDMTIEVTLEGKGTTEGSRPVMRDLIARRPDLNAVFAINDPSALGCVSALESAGKLSGVKIVSVDGARDAMVAIRNGKLLSTSAQFPKEIGEKAAEVAFRHLAGESVEKEVKVRVELITRDNVEKHLAP